MTQSQKGKFVLDGQKRAKIKSEPDSSGWKSCLCPLNVGCSGAEFTPSSWSLTEEIHLSHVYYSTDILLLSCSLKVVLGIRNPVPLSGPLTIICSAQL